MAFAALAACGGAACSLSAVDVTEGDAWEVAASSTSQVPLGRSGSHGKPAPKNIILMIGDGMGFNHSLAGSYYRFGHAGKQVHQHFPVRLAVSTYPGADQMGAPPGDPCVNWGYDPAQAWSDFQYVNQCYTDSAAAATAMATGVKTYNAAIGVDLFGNTVGNVREAAEALGKATGVVTTVPFSHATPAGFVAHNVDRNDYHGIADEMILSSDVDVIMGGGHPWYTESNQLRQAPVFTYIGPAAWTALEAGTAGGDADNDGIPDSFALVEARGAFKGLMSGPTPKRVFGMARVAATLQQERGGNGNAPPFAVPLSAGVPTLTEMSRAALNVLDNDPDGLFLVIEGGAVDWASHDNQKGRMIEELVDFEKAIEAVVDWVKHKSDWGETLLIVTADHETGYLFGEGSDPTWEPLTNNGKGALPGMQWNSVEHTNSLVPLFAKGKGAHAFKILADGVDPVRGGYIDNTDIPAVIFDMLGN